MLSPSCHLVDVFFAGPYAASATGGNGFARDFLAGISAMYATPFYTNIGTRFALEWPSTILAVLAALLTIPVYASFVMIRSELALT